MKVIIKKTNEVKKVSFGYAVNYLIPKGLAVLATKENIKLLKQQKKLKINEQKKKEKENEILAQEIIKKKVIIKVKVDKNGKNFFGSVSKKNILRALGIDSKKVKVDLKKPIKSLGKHKVSLKIGSKRIKIEVKVIKS